MSPIEEMRFLTIVLRRIDHGTVGLLASRFALPVIWGGLVLCSAIAFAIAQILPTWAVALLFVGLGVAYSQLYFRVFGARGWSILRQHLNRESVVARLSQLGP